MLNSVQRKLLFAGTAITILSVMLFSCALQQFFQKKTLTQQILQDVGTNTIVYLSSQQLNSNGYMTMSDNMYSELSKHLNAEMLYTPIVKLWQGSFPVIAPNDMDVQYETTVLGSSENYASIADVDVLQGSFFSKTDCAEKRNVCVISQAFLSYNGLVYSDNLNIVIDNISFSVIGMIDFPQTTDTETGVFEYIHAGEPLIVVPFTTLTEIENAVAGVDFIVGRPLNAEEYSGIKEFAGHIMGILGKNSGTILQETQENGEAKLLVFPESEIYLNMQSSDIGTIVVGIIISTLMLLLSGINIVQIVVSAIYDNQQKIAVKIALGATDFQLAKEIFTELFIINIKGGYTGLALSGIAIVHINASLFQYTLAFNICSLLIGAAAVFLLSVFSVILPFLHLSNLQPAQAIRG